MNKRALCIATAVLAATACTEPPGDGLDNDCDGAVDETCACEGAGVTRECFLGDPATCPPGLPCRGDCVRGVESCTEFLTWGACAGALNGSGLGGNDAWMVADVQFETDECGTIDCRIAPIADLDGNPVILRDESFGPPWSDFQARCVPPAGAASRAMPVARCARVREGEMGRRNLESTVPALRRRAG